MAKKVLPLNKGRMVVTITRKELDKYLKIFADKTLLSLPGNRFAYFMEKNFDILEKEVQNHQKFNSEQMKVRGEISEKYLEAEKSVISEFCKKDEAGNPILSNGNYSIPNEKFDEFIKTKKALMKKQKLTAEDNRIEAYNNAMDEYMSEEITIEFRKISEDQIPVNINGNQRIMIREFIME
jgi:hypothetical protein